MISFRPCACGSEDLVRLQRALWMRLFRTRRLYYCERCRSKLFIRKSEVLAQSTRPSVKVGG